MLSLGCDSTSAIHGYGKKTDYSKLRRHEKAFYNLASSRLKRDNDMFLPICHQFILLFHGVKASNQNSLAKMSLNEIRFKQASTTDKHLPYQQQKMPFIRMSYVVKYKFKQQLNTVGNGCLFPNMIASEQPQ
ncbi:unnamed protein product [Owenia fusiformis]|uniref:Uncharacterized protein n=1 Tax=Owenia fusiformis TaxID=6347 RepID=A0A8J1UG88_OWEFU|nr:unnamed protein product [Owenia fusiformis]